jgi:hypothetical protein
MRGGEGYENICGLFNKCEIADGISSLPTNEALEEISAEL